MDTDPPMVYDFGFLSLPEEFQDGIAQVSHLVCNTCSGLISTPVDPDNPPALIASGGVYGPSCTCERDQ